MFRLILLLVPLNGIDNVCVCEFLFTLLSFNLRQRQVPSVTSAWTVHVTNLSTRPSLDVEACFLCSLKPTAHQHGQHAHSPFDVLILCHSSWINAVVFRRVYSCVNVFTSKDGASTWATRGSGDSAETVRNSTVRSKGWGGCREWGDLKIVCEVHAICGVHREAYKYICKYCCWQWLAFKYYWASRLLISFLLVYKATSSILSSRLQLSCFFFNLYYFAKHCCCCFFAQCLAEITSITNKKWENTQSLPVYGCILIGFTAWISNTGNRITDLTRPARSELCDKPLHRVQAVQK